jgi:Na+/citrate or Na+/malate symporter
MMTDPKWRVGFIPIPYFVVAFGLMVLASYVDALPPSMVTGFAVTGLLGGLLMWIGNSIPKVREYGLPTLLCTFVPSILYFGGVIPENIQSVVSTFLADQGFLDFFVSAIIVGALLGMPRALLVKAGPRFFFPLIVTILGVFALMGAISFLLGNGFMEGVLFYAAPIMAGGLGLGAVPMAEMYAEQLGTEPSMFMGTLMSVVALANMMCVIFAGLLRGATKNGKQWFVGFNGNGELMRIQGNKKDFQQPAKSHTTNYVAMFQGLMMASIILVVGGTLSTAIGGLHMFAWAIIVTVILKIAKLLPKELENAATQWGDFVNTTLLSALLVAVSLTYIDLNEVVEAVTSAEFLLMTLSAVVAAALISGVSGWIVKFYFVEAAVIPGLIMADSGGSGDVAVLSAADRMHLMPFAAIATRIGGTITLFLATLLAPFL